MQVKIGRGSRRSAHVLGTLLVMTSLSLTSGCIFFDEQPGGTVQDSDAGSEDMGGADQDSSVTDSGADLSTDPCALVDCAEGLVCEAGSCVCSAQACGALGELFICSDNACVQQGCITSDQCGPSQMCEAGTCKDVVCSSDGECPGGSICVDEACVIACVKNDECPGANNVCEGGRCSDLLSDPMHCGAPGVMCGSGRECVDGFCTCGNLSVDTNAKSIKIFSSSGDYKVWPGAQLIAYPTLDHYRCSIDGVSLEECGQMRGEILFNEDYPLSAPHFIAVGATDRFNTPDSLVFRKLSGQGATIGSELVLDGVEDLLQRSIVNYRLVRIGVEGYLVFVQWRQGEKDRIYGYFLTVSNGGMGLTPIPDSSGMPAVWAEEPNMTDFSVALLPTGGDRVSVGMAITTMNSGSLSDGGKLTFRGFDFTDSFALNESISSDSYEFEEMRQFAEGMGVVMRRGPDNQIFAHVLALDSISYGTPLADRAVNIKAYTNLFTFEKKGSNDDFSLVRDAIRTLGGTYVNELDIVGAYLSGDRTVLPADSYLFWDEGEMVLQRLGWDFVGARNMPLRTQTNFVAVNPGRVTPGVVTLDSTADNLRVFDAAVAVEGERDFFVHHVEQTSENDAKVFVYGLTKNSTTSADEYTEGKAVTPAKRYRRVSAVPGPHATGVLVNSSSRDEGAELYFVAGGNMPICN